jgi:hypothetical protein
MSSNERHTPMVGATGDIPVQRVELPEHFSSEPDLSHHWVTSTQPHWSGLVQVNDGNIRNLQTVLFSIEADKQMRRNALRQLQTNVAQRECEDSAAVLAQWRDSGLTLD